jgi:hypothetical protein
MLEVCPKNNKCLNAISVEDVVAGFQNITALDPVAPLFTPSL